MTTNTETFFEVLKAHRKSKNIEISEISDFTKINAKYIEAIELGDFTILPNVYMRLFIKAYSNFIGTDTDKVLKDYELYTTGIISERKNIINISKDKNDNASYYSQNNITSNTEINQKSIVTGIAVVLSIFFFLWWAGKVTNEQSENINELSIINANNNNLMQDKTFSKIPNNLPLNANDFSQDRLLKEKGVTEIINITSPYQISISTLNQTKIHLSENNEDKVIELINQVVDVGENLTFNFKSIINFEFWSNQHIKVFINNISLDKYFNNDEDLMIRGSYESKKSQLYISFYKR